MAPHARRRSAGRPSSAPRPRSSSTARTPSSGVSRNMADFAGRASRNCIVNPQVDPMQARDMWPNCPGHRLSRNGEYHSSVLAAVASRRHASEGKGHTMVSGQKPLDAADLLRVEYYPANGERGFWKLKFAVTGLDQTDDMFAVYRLLQEPIASAVEHALRPESEVASFQRAMNPMRRAAELRTVVDQVFQAADGDSDGGSLQLTARVKITRSKSRSLTLMSYDQGAVAEDVEATSSTVQQDVRQRMQQTRRFAAFFADHLSRTLSASTWNRTDTASAKTTDVVTVSGVSFSSVVSHPSEIELRGGYGEALVVSHVPEESRAAEAGICEGYELVMMDCQEADSQVWRNINFDSLKNIPCHDILALGKVQLPARLAFQSPLWRLPNLSERQLAERMGLRKVKELHHHRLVKELLFSWRRLDVQRQDELDLLQEAVTADRATDDAQLSGADSQLEVSPLPVADDTPPALTDDPAKLDALALIENPLEQARTYSSVFASGDGTKPVRSRLDGKDAWRADSNDARPWLQIDLGAVQVVAGVVIQGGGSSLKQWVTEFTVEHSTNKRVWMQILDSFEGNRDPDTHARRLFPRRASARYLRCKPKVDVGEGPFAMRLGVLIPLGQGLLKPGMPVRLAGGKKNVLKEHARLVPSQSGSDQDHGSPFTLTCTNLRMLELPAHLEVGQPRQVAGIRLPQFRRALRQAGIHWLNHEQEVILMQALHPSQEDVDRDGEHAWEMLLSEVFVMDTAGIFTHIGRVIKSQNVRDVTRELEVRLRKQRERGCFAGALTCKDFEEAMNQGGIDWLTREQMHQLYNTIKGSPHGVSMADWLCRFRWDPQEAAHEVQRAYVNYLEVDSASGHRRLGAYMGREPRPPPPLRSWPSRGMGFKDLQARLVDMGANWLTATEKQQALFQTMDTDRSGKITEDEMRSLLDLRAKLEMQFEESAEEARARGAVQGTAVDEADDTLAEDAEAPFDEFERVDGAADVDGAAAAAEHATTANSATGASAEPASGQYIRSLADVAGDGAGVVGGSAADANTRSVANDDMATSEQAAERATQIETAGPALADHPADGVTADESSGHALAGEPAAGQHFDDGGLADIHANAPRGVAADASAAAEQTDSGGLADIHANAPRGVAADASAAVEQTDGGGLADIHANAPRGVAADASAAVEQADGGGLAEIHANVPRSVAAAATAAAAQSGGGGLADVAADGARYNPITEHTTVVNIMQIDGAADAAAHDAAANIAASQHAGVHAGDSANKAQTAGIDGVTAETSAAVNHSDGCDLPADGAIDHSAAEHTTAMVAGAGESVVDAAARDATSDNVIAVKDVSGHGDSNVA